MENKKNLVYTIIAVLVLLAAIVSATYAYFVGSVSGLDNTTDVLTSTRGSDAVFTTTGASLNLVVGVEDMTHMNAGTGQYSSSNANLTVTLENTSARTTCTYDIVFTDTTNNYVPTANLEQHGGKEFTLQSTMTVNGTKGKEGTNSIKNELQWDQLHNVTDGVKGNTTGNRVLVKNASITAQKRTTTVDWTFTLKYYNLDVVQPSNQSYAGYLKVENVMCGDEVQVYELAGEIMALADSEKTSSQDNSSKWIVRNQNGYRYEGKDPDNYVTFNGTKADYRIIGTFEGSTIGLEAGKYYTKLIKTTGLSSNMAWDASDNNWNTADLNNHLNTTYLGELSGVSSKIVTPKYYLGAAPGSAWNTYTTEQWYNAERGDTPAKAGGSVLEITDKKIGLMYPSDYGYAMYAGADIATCINTNNVYTYYSSEQNCRQYDWLSMINGSYTTQWTITPYSDSTYGAFFVISSGYVYNGGVDNTNAVRPVLYLEADAEYLPGGNGSKNNPYVIK